MKRNKNQNFNRNRIKYISADKNQCILFYINGNLHEGMIVTFMYTVAVVTVDMGFAKITIITLKAFKVEISVIRAR